MIPKTFEEWKDCITNNCKIPLTKEFAAQRLVIYQNRLSPETQQFVSLYGEQHLLNIVNWLEKV